MRNICGKARNLLNARVARMAMVVLFAMFCACLGFVAGRATFTPKMVEVKVPEVSYITVTQYVPHYIPYPVDRIVTVTVTEKVPVEVIVRRNIPARDFASAAAFKEWYGTLDLKALFPASDNETDSYYAAALQKAALERGYSVSQALTRDGEYCGVKVADEKGEHVGNLVLIKGVYYYVEPDPEKFKIIKLIERD